MNSQMGRSFTEDRGPIRAQRSSQDFVARLPEHHRNPFDRLLIVQATIEELPLLTADRRLEAYDVHIEWAD